jgi:hypothetical protein
VPAELLLSRNLAIAAVLTLSPAVAIAAPRPSPSVVVQATVCYGRGDLACVIALLEPAPPQPLYPESAAERLRLLAFAAARLDRHDLAQTAFSRWIDDGHRLDATTTPPVVFADYSAAMVRKLTPLLDVTPQIDHRPQLPAPAMTAADLPRFPPPPRSSRDAARDIGFRLAGNGAGGPGHLVPGLGVAIGLDLHGAGRMFGGLELGAWRPDQRALHRDVTEAGASLATFAAAHVGWTAVDAGTHSLHALARLGGMAHASQDLGGSTMGIAGGVRYDFTPRGWLGGFVGCDGWWFGAARPLVVTSVGVLLRPNAETR